MSTKACNAFINLNKLPDLFLYFREKMAFPYLLIAFLLTINISGAIVGAPTSPETMRVDDRDRIHIALNLEFLETEFFLNGALGRGLDSIAPELAAGGPPPAGAKKANLDFLTKNIIEEFAYQEIGHLRAIISTIGGFPRPQLDLSPQNFANIFDHVAGYNLVPPFDPYFNTVNYLLASYAIPYVGLVGYVGTIPNLVNSTSRRLVAGLLGVESGQDAVIRTLLYQRANEKVFPYSMTVADFTNRISDLRNRLGMSGNKDEGLIVPQELGAENRTQSNILSADANSLSYSRTPPEIFRIVYGTGSENKPGGFFPNGANGRIAKGFLARI
ncbi:Desiccation-related protein PCC13-62 [Melia azedarach]|uniref:Desiccation-related protein PCC13-62 n=1 Tax=Melia azedarach TaxID=155640 RepID=A0ACC1XQT3_MELAZ|nr:Desiccation-related protein PCC13-62 [Melia azedarach]